VVPLTALSSALKIQACVYEVCSPTVVMEKISLEIQRTKSVDQ